MVLIKKKSVSTSQSIEKEFVVSLLSLFPGDGSGKPRFGNSIRDPPTRFDGEGRSLEDRQKRSGRLPTHGSAIGAEIGTRRRP